MLTECDNKLTLYDIIHPYFQNRELIHAIFKSPFKVHLTVMIYIVEFLCLLLNHDARYSAHIHCENRYNKSIDRKICNHQGSVHFWIGGHSQYQCDY